MASAVCQHGGAMHARNGAANFLFQRPKKFVARNVERFSVRFVGIVAESPPATEACNRVAAGYLGEGLSQPQQAPAMCFPGPADTARAGPRFDNCLQRL